VGRSTRIAETLGTKALRRLGATFEVLEYDHRAKGAEYAAAALGVPLARFAKTLVVEIDGEPAFVLTPGDRELSLRALARSAGARGATMVAPAVAERLTGYQTGGISPFGARRALPAYIDASLVEHERMYLNGGRRGVVVDVPTTEVRRLLRAHVSDLGA
jgi:Cys-tRNA(Pro)/Cys-tRNA(Cys) deacylase